MQKNISRTDAARINLRWSAAGILFSLIFGSFSRKIFVFVLGKEFVGLSSLMGNMMAVLSLLDFGAAGAVIYRLYAPLAKAVEGMDFEREEFVPIDLSNEKFYCLVLKGKTQVLAFVRSKKYSWQNVLRDGKTVGYESGTIDFSGVLAKNVDIIPIWKDERDKVRFDGGILTVEKCKRGFLLKGYTGEMNK